MAAAPILYVEDEELDVLLIREAFQAAQLQVPLAVAVDGEEAIDYLAGVGRFRRETHPLPQLVLLDVNLPRRSGFEVLAWIREQPELRDLPVVVYSSSTSDSDRSRALDLGAHDYWVKAFDHGDRVEQVLELRRRWLE